MNLVFSLLHALLLLLYACLGFMGRHPGLLLVLIGVAGEIICDWREMVGHLARVKRIFAILLILGLVVEFIEAAKSDKEVAELKRQTALVASSNLMLKTNVLALELKLQPRAITPEQQTALIKLLSNCSKGKVYISAGAFDGEATTFAQQIEDVLKKSGFEVAMPKFPDPDTPVSLSQPGQHLVVKNPKHPPNYAPGIQQSFAACGIVFDGFWGDEPFDSNRVEIAIGQKY